MDTVYVEFLNDIENDACRTVYAANGPYIIPSSTAVDIKIPGFVLIVPQEQTQENKLTLYSARHLVNKLPTFEIPVYYYKYATEQQLDSIYQRLSDVYYSKDYFLKQNYVSDMPNEYKRMHEDEFRDSINKVLEEERKQDSIARIKGGILGGAVNVPTAGVIDGVYITHPKLIRADYIYEHPEEIDSIRQLYSEIREKEIRPLLDSLLQPFYISQTEVTNKEYREFIDYVKDSIALNKLFYGLTNPEVVTTLIDAPKKITKNVTSLDEILALKEKYGLTKERYEGRWKSIYNYPDFVPFLADMYYPQPARFYKRREIDHRKLIYTMDGESVAIYPDTLAFLESGASHAELYSNMYNWHPYYDNFPVLHINQHQMLAFCHWKQKQLNQKLQLTTEEIRVSIPTITQYEMALKYAAVGQNNATHDLSNSEFITYERADSALWRHFIHRVTLTPSNVVHAIPDYLMWFNANYNAILRFINGNAAEVVMDPVTNERLKLYNMETVDDPATYCFILGGDFFTGVKTMSDNQYNALFYKGLIKKDKTTIGAGFRLVYTIVPKTK